MTLATGRLRRQDVTYMEQALCEIHLFDNFTVLGWQVRCSAVTGSSHEGSGSVGLKKLIREERAGFDAGYLATVKARARSLRLAAESARASEARGYRLFGYVEPDYGLV